MDKKKNERAKVGKTRKREKEKVRERVRQRVKLQADKGEKKRRHI